MLGAIHGNLGVAKQVFRCGLRCCATAEDHANAGADDNLLAIYRERIGQPLLNAVRHADCIAWVLQLRCENDEFISTRPGERVIGGEHLAASAITRNCVVAAQTGSEAACDLDEQFVAGGVSEAVVEDLKVVDIDIKDGEPEIRMSACNLNGALQTVQKKEAVRKICQRIMERTMFEQRL